MMTDLIEVISQQAEEWFKERGKLLRVDQDIPNLTEYQLRFFSNGCGDDHLWQVGNTTICIRYLPDKGTIRANTMAFFITYEIANPAFPENLFRDINSLRYTR